MAAEKVAKVEVTRVDGEARDVRDDSVAVEEPLEIGAAWHVGGELREKTISVTMRTPGDDLDLAAGFLFSEGFVRSGGDIESVRHWGSANKVRVAIRAEAAVDTSRIARNFYTPSGCGLCGKTSVESLRTDAEPFPAAAVVDGGIIAGLPRLLADHQAAFHLTGGLHGAAIVDESGSLLRAREDIGRHNAVDKVIGSYVREASLPPAGALLMVSSRGSFDIVQKAIVARIATVVFVGPPSSLAVELARAFNVALIGFLRNGRFNVYSGSVG